MTAIDQSIREVARLDGTLLVATPDVWLLSGAALLLTLIAWRIHDLAQARRQRELRLAVRERTEQLERAMLADASRNRIMQMLVSNQPLSPVLDAIVRSAQDQIPGARAVILVKQGHSRQPADERRVFSGQVSASQVSASDFFIGSAPDLPEDWQGAIGDRYAVPFEVWRQRCDYPDPGEEPAWRLFFHRLREQNAAADVPLTIRSLPIGESGVSQGAILLMYSQPGGNDAWDEALCVASRLAQIALEHRRFYDELDFQAHHDGLTGVANRALFDEQLERAILNARSASRRLAVLYIDIDEFKKINDRLSHRAGDTILMETARRMQAALRPGDMVARMGGDEFNVLLPDIDDASTADELALRLLEAVRRPISVDGRDVSITISIGIAIFPDDGEGSDDPAATLQREADAAMYCAKNMGKNRIRAFAANSATPDKLRMEQELRHALHEGWFTVHYQPKFTATDKLAGLEALIRMNHPRHGIILPGQFIPTAETSGLIVPVGAWVIDEVCRQIADWRRKNMMPVVVAVNVSAIQMARHNFTKCVEACLTAHGVPAHSLELEVTESMLIDTDSEERRQMQLLRALGVAISIDDFGTGFSSLSYLHRLQIDAIKLDQSFVRTIETDEATQRMMRAVIGVARGLGLDVIAEGVETEAQRAELIKAGCPVMQGYLFAHPGPPEAMQTLLCPSVPAQTGHAEEAEANIGRLYRALSAATEKMVHEAATAPAGLSALAESVADA